MQPVRWVLGDIGCREYLVWPANALLAYGSDILIGSGSALKNCAPVSQDGCRFHQKPAGPAGRVQDGFAKPRDPAERGTAVEPYRDFREI